LKQNIKGLGEALRYYSFFSGC